MRLAIVRQKYNPAGGAERFVSRALTALSATGSVEVSLIARRWETLEGIRALKADPFYLGNVWRDWGFALAARRLWERAGFDLVQSHERIPGCHVYRAGDGVHRHWLALRRRTLTAAGRWALALNPYHAYVQWAERRMFLHPNLKRVICNSRMVQTELEQYFGLPAHKSVVIYNGVDTARFHPSLRALHRQAQRQALRVPEEAALLIYVGSGFERKGVARALQALVAAPQAWLVVVGHDKHAGRYQGLAESLGVAGRVRFAGAQKDVRPFYGMADAFILPTLYDPFPNVCVEALACGLPVFTTVQCGAAELIRDDENGWICDALDVTKLGTQVARWSQSRADWPRLAEAARATAEPLTLEAMAEALLDCYRTLL